MIHVYMAEYIVGKVLQLFHWPTTPPPPHAFVVKHECPCWCSSISLSKHQFEDDFFTLVPMGGYSRS